MPEEQEHIVSPPVVTIIWDPEFVDPDEYARLVVALGDVARALGCVGVEHLDSTTYLVEVEGRDGG